LQWDLKYLNPYKKGGTLMKCTLRGSARDSNFHSPAFVVSSYHHHQYLTSHLWTLTSGLSPLDSHLWPLASGLSPLTSHLLPFPNCIFLCRHPHQIRWIRWSFLSFLPASRTISPQCLDAQAFFKSSQGDAMCQATTRGRIQVR
jgi:hypothetical protein